MRDNFCVLSKAALGLAFALVSLTLSAQQIPLAKNVHMGKLDNGLTYYIQNNNTPADHVELYLVNNVGSLLEDDDQQGLAHFMEHMNFNGTRKYPKNELVNVLEKAGIRFGADLNALTGFNETFYKLPVSTKDPSMIEKGLGILREWAHEATIDPSEVDSERGVILEEGRLRKGVNDRMSKTYFPMLLNHSRYVNRFPIGLDQVIENAPASLIRRFYADWYRPNLQAIIVVGSVNVSETEKKIKSIFGDLRNPAKERKRPVFDVPLANKNQYLAVTDPEYAGLGIQIYFKRNKRPIISIEDYENEIVSVLMDRMISARRRAYVSERSQPSFLSMGLSRDKFLGNLETLNFTMDLKMGKLEEGFKQAYTLLARIRKYGFTEQDLITAKEQLRRDLVHKKTNNTYSSANLAAELQNNFLYQTPVPDVEWELSALDEIFPHITNEKINERIGFYTAAENRDILVLANENLKKSIPTEEEILTWMHDVDQESLSPFVDYIIETNLLEGEPKAGHVIQTNNMSGITELILSNGVKVIVKPTNYKMNEVSVGAFAPGGTSLYSDREYFNAINALPLVNSFGYGRFNPEALNKALQGKNIAINTTLDQRILTMNGRADSADLKDALQLIHLMFTAPRKDEVLFTNILSRSKETFRQRYSTPGNVFADSIAYVIGNYHYRALPTTVDRIDSIKLDEVYRIYKERFEDASAFTFVFVGAVDMDKFVPLLETYLGSLPSQGKNEKPNNIEGMHVPRGVVEKRIYAGQENASQVRMVLSGDFEYSPSNIVSLKALSEILQMRILANLRENLGKVYSPSVQVVYNKVPKNRYAFFVTFGCAPQYADELVGLVQKEFETLKNTGVTTDELKKFKAAYANSAQKALSTNEFWKNYIMSALQNNDPMDVNATAKLVEQLDLTTIKGAANRYMVQNNLLKFILFPKNMQQQ